MIDAAWLVTDPYINYNFVRFPFCPGVGPLQGIPAVHERGDHRVHEHVLGRVLRIVQERLGHQESTGRGQSKSFSGIHTFSRVCIYIVRMEAISLVRFTWEKKVRTICQSETFSRKKFLIN